MMALLFMLATLVPVGATGAPFSQASSVIFFGDSITEAGFRSPRGYGSILQAKLPHIKLIGRGVSGNTVEDLHARVDRAVLRAKPSHVLIYIGTNDIWREESSSAHFKARLEQLIDRITAAGITVGLCTPAVLGEDVASLNNQRLQDYVRVVGDLASSRGLPLCNLHAAFKSRISSGLGPFTSDGVHMNSAGDMLIADVILAEVFR